MASDLPMVDLQIPVASMKDIYAGKLVVVMGRQAAYARLQFFQN